jgi:hypothetical protein
VWAKESAKNDINTLKAEAGVAKTVVNKTDQNFKHVL